MKKLVLYLLFCSTPLFAQTFKDRQAVLYLLEKQTKHWNSGNIDAFMKGYLPTDSLMFIGKSGITYGWQNTLDNYKKRYPDLATMGKLRFEIVKIDFLSKKSCWLLGKWYLTRPEKGDIGGYYTLVLKKANGVWLIVSDHTS